MYVLEVPDHNRARIVHREQRAPHREKLLDIAFVSNQRLDLLHALPHKDLASARRERQLFLREHVHRQDLLWQLRRHQHGGQFITLVHDKRLAQRRRRKALLAHAVPHNRQVVDDESDRAEALQQTAILAARQLVVCSGRGRWCHD